MVSFCSTEIEIELYELRNKLFMHKRNSQYTCGLEKVNLDMACTQAQEYNANLKGIL